MRCFSKMFFKSVCGTAILKELFYSRTMWLLASKEKKSPKPSKDSVPSL